MIPAITAPTGLGFQITDKTVCYSCYFVNRK